MSDNRESTDLLPDLYIDFDGRQLEFRTNIPEVREEMVSMFRHMLRDTVSEPGPSLAVTARKEGIRVDSAQMTFFKDRGLDELMPLFKDEVRLQFMRSRPDLLWMHSAAVERDDKALLISAPSGQGKSTLSTHLFSLGWKFLSDDIAPVRMDDDRVIPFPQSPMRRIHPGHVIAKEELHTLERETVDIPREMVCTTQPHIAAMVFISWSKGSDATLNRLTMGAGALEILRNATNFYDHREGAVSRAVELVKRVPVYALTYDAPLMGATKLDDIWSQI
jgi:hypothetical protein